MSFIHALKWSFLSELAAKAIQPIVFIVLARLLTPEDFGVMSAALMVIAFSQIFWEAGMGKALIQRQSDIEDAANAAFWINIGLGIVIATSLFVVASPVAHIFFHDDRVTAVLQIMTIQVFLGSASAVHTALLQKEMGFKKLFWVRFATVSLPGLASIPMAWKGMGYWALVVGTLVGQATQVVMLWRISGWRPRLTFNTQVARGMGYFGAWVGASGILTWFYGWADSLIVGMYLGSHELGLYRTGNQFAIMIFAILLGPITPVLYSHLSKMNQNKDNIRNATEKVIKVLTLISVPLALIVFSLAGSISDALFGEKWQGIELVIGVMALMHGFSWVVGMNGEVYRAMGKPSYETIVTSTTLVIYLMAYLVAIEHGFEAFIWTRLGLALGALLLHLLVSRIVLHLPILRVMQYLFLIALVCGTLVLSVKYVTANYVSEPWPKLIFGGLMNLFFVCGAILLIERDGMLKELKSLIQRSAT